MNPDQLKTKLRSELHLARKLYHVIGVLIIAGLYQVLTREQGLWALGISMLIVIPIDLIRLRVPFLNHLCFRGFGTFLRTEEATRVSGMTHLLTGTFFIIAVFPEEIAALSLLFLAFGDPIASTVGIRYGKDKILPNKSLQGTMAAFVVCTIIALLYFIQTGILTERLILASVFAGMIGAVSELVSIDKLDDNFTIPVLSACLLWILFRFFGGF